MSEKRNFRFFSPVQILLAISLAFILSSCTVDCNVPDLITAIDNANANPAHSTLHLESGCTYTLTAIDNTATSSFGGSLFEYGDNGLPQITTPITFNGNDATIIRDGGAPDFRIFFVTDSGTLTINDLTLENGFANGNYEGGGSGFPGSGGAIYSEGSFVEINDSTLQGNQATFDGGAFFTFGTTSTYINGSTIQDNTAPNGGGVFIYSTMGLLSVDNSEILNNTGSTQGGGIDLAYGAELIINNSLIATNHSGRRGGGLYKGSSLDHLPSTITNTTFQDNTADWSGGGIYITRTPLTILDSQFKNNQAGEYAGGLGYISIDTDTVLISGTTFDGNTAVWDGGAIHFSGERMSINNSTIQNNTAENGAGIFSGDADDPKYLIRTDPITLIVTGSTVQENIASENGGGTYSEGIMTCGESSFVANESTILGGGIHNAGTLEVLGCIFDKNKTNEDGGGINNVDIAEVRSSDFTNNTSKRGGGFASVDGSAEITDSTFIDNSASGQGGAIFNFGTISGSSPMEIRACEIKNNTALSGGGIASTEGPAQIVETTISGNKSSSEGGGVANNGIMTLALTTLHGNEASTLGGGVHSTGEIDVKDCTFEDNLAFADGGGLNTYDKASVSGSTFVGNTAFRGGGLSSVGGDTVMTNNTFSANTATDSGGGIFNMGPLIGDTTPGGALQANHITVAYNSAPAGGGIATTGGGLRIKNSIVALNLSGADCQTSAIDFTAFGENIDTDGTCPGFTSKEDPLLDVLANYGGPTFTHALLTGSPAIDAAPDCTTVGGAAVSVDQRGSPRPGGFACDQGAYEDSSGGPLPKMEPCIYTAAVNLNCRLGPDNSLYPIVDSFKAGQNALAVGRSWDKVFAYVIGPINNEICAVPVTVRFGTLTGDCENLPIIEPLDVDEDLDKDEQPGCTIKDQFGALVCVVPCPPDARPGDPCTP